MFFDGQKIHEVFHNISTVTLRAICWRHMQEVTVNARTDLYILIFQQSASFQGSICQTGVEAMQTGGQRYS